MLILLFFSMGAERLHMKTLHLGSCILLVQISFTHCADGWKTNPTFLATALKAGSLAEKERDSARAENARLKEQIQELERMLTGQQQYGKWFKEEYQKACATILTLQGIETARMGHKPNGHEHNKELVRNHNRQKAQQTRAA